MQRPTIAIIGSGAAAMACGHLLHKDFDLTVYEKNAYLGGHANTVTIETAEETVHVDTAFVVFNNVAYPLFCRLLEELEVDHMQCGMSFGFQIPSADWVYMTRGLSYCFCDKNLFKPGFIKMLYQMWRFHRSAKEVLEDPKYHHYTIAEYAQEKGYGHEFLHFFLIPLIAVTWSLPSEKMLDYPILTLVRFLDNHGALQGVTGKKHWRTVVNGSGAYIQKVSAPFKERILTNRGVTQVVRADDRVAVTDESGETRHFDKVIFACHADQALAMLEAPSDLQCGLLSKFGYCATKSVLHTDATLMPTKRKHWACWNYLIEEDEGGNGHESYTYHMNTLQKVSKHRDYFVTVNGSQRIDLAQVIKEFDYEHPIFDLAAIQAQQDLPRLNEAGPVYFCGSYFGFGFHEDAFRSGVEVCRRIIGDDLWR